MNLMPPIIEQVYKEYYEEGRRQSKYIKKYEKLQWILECKKDNRRAQIELMLILMNEGYEQIVKQEFPEEDYKFLKRIIAECQQKIITIQNAKKQIDEWSL